MKKYRGAGFYLLLMLGIFTLGIAIGAIYSAGMGKADSDEVYKYLCDFFENNTRSGMEIFLTSFFDNLKLFFIIFIAGFFKFGMPFIMGAGCMEGFVSGFTTASLIKLMGFKGFLINLSGVLSVLIFVANLVFFGAYAMHFGISGGKRERNEKKAYIVFSAAALTIFCVASLFDGYITTTFMRMIVTKM